MKTGWISLMLMAITGPTWAQNPRPASYPPPTHLGDPAKLGVGVQRTMALLAGSTPQHRNTVRVLFYGQSITEQDWWKDVAADLKRRFPNADLLIENRALGGFSSQLLVKTAESDLYPFYPDLMIFHVYGAHNNYEEIIRRTRERTTSEVLIQTDHVTNDADLTEETDPAKLYPNGKIWNSFMNYLWLPTVAKKYGCALLEQRDLWKLYLKDNNVHAAQLLKDGVHQNDYGNFLMAALVKPYLVRRSDTPIDPMQCDTVKTLAVGKDIHAKSGKLKLEFTGNRVDVILAKGSDTPVEVLLDGKKPSEHTELFGFTRALSTPGSKWPVILKIGSEKIPVEEAWTLRVKKDAANDKLFTFAVEGSKTGPDGDGRSDQRFVSKSGRIVIDPADWNVEYSLALPGIKPVPDHFEVHWQTVPHCVDTFTPTHPQDRTVESVITLAQGLVHGKHTLELSGISRNAISAIRVYRPPVASATLDVARGPAR